MNKRQKKKRFKKCLPVTIDENPILMTNSAEEYDELIKAINEYKLKFGYRRKYSDLKKEEAIHYLTKKDQ